MKPSTKQKNTTGSLITKVDSVKQIFPKLDDKTVTVYDAYQKETKLGDLKNNKENNELTEILGVWSALVGYDAKPEELILIQKVIKNRFRTFTIEDIKYASELATEGKFKTRYKGSFSALYVQSSLAEYKEVRGNIVVTINERIKAIEKCQSLPVPDTEETVESYRFLIHNAYDNQKDIKKEDDYIDLGDVLYNFIKYNKLIKLTNRILMTLRLTPKKI